MTAQKSMGVSGRGCMPLCRAFLNRPHLCALTGLSHKPSVAPACLPSTLRARLVTCFAGYWRLQRNPLWGKQRKRWKRVRCLFGSVLHFSLSPSTVLSTALSHSLSRDGEKTVYDSSLKTSGLGGEFSPSPMSIFFLFVVGHVFFLLCGWLFFRLYDPALLGAGSKAVEEKHIMVLLVVLICTNIHYNSLPFH